MVTCSLALEQADHRDKGRTRSPQGLRGVEMRSDHYGCGVLGGDVLESDGGDGCAAL